MVEMIPLIWGTWIQKQENVGSGGFARHDDSILGVDGSDGYMWNASVVHLWVVRGIWTV